MAKKNRNKLQAPKQFFKTLENVIGFLEQRPYVEKIYINSKGEYHLQPVEGFEEYSAEELLNDYSQIGADSSETYDHVVTEDDLTNNPELIEQGIKVGDTIQVPKTKE